MDTFWQDRLGDPWQYFCTRFSIPLCPGSSSSHEAIWYPEFSYFVYHIRIYRHTSKECKWDSKLEIHQVWRLALKLDFHKSLHRIDAMRHSLTTTEGGVMSRGDMNVLSHCLEHDATGCQHAKDAWEVGWEVYWDIFGSVNKVFSVQAWGPEFRSPVPI